MPAVGAPRGGNKFAHPAPPPHPRPAAPPRPPLHAAPGIGSRRTYIAPSHHAPDYRAVGQAPHTHTAGGRGTVHQSAAQYHAAVREVFLHQNAAGREAILRGLAHGGNVFQQETRAVHDAARFAQRQGGKEFAAAAHTAPRVVTRGGDLGAVGKALSGVGNYLEKQMMGHLDITSPFGGTGIAAVRQAEGRTNRAIQALPLPKPMNKETQLAGVGTPPQQVAKNLLKDAVDLPAEALPSLAIPVAAAAHGHWKDALHMATDPYVQALKHPAQAFSQHPLITPLMFMGAKGGLRGVDPALRAVTKERLVPESVHLTGNLTHERPNWAKDVVTRSGQKSVARHLYARNVEGKLVPRSDAVHARLVKIETSRLVGQNERVRRAGHSEEMAAHADAVLRGKGARAAHATATALKYNPEPALIHGANVLGLITQGVIRRPETFVADLTRHIEKVSALRHELLDYPASLKTHDEYVKMLKEVRDRAVKDKRLAQHLAPAFKAAARYAKEYAPTEKAAQRFGHFRDMTDDALHRRTLMAAVESHMPGARFDAELGMVVDRRLANGHTEARKLSTQEMESFVRRETGGRRTAFVSHELKRGDKAHYVRGQARPFPAGMGNTLYNFRHGLTDPTHEAMLEQRVRMRGIVDSHRAMNRLDQQLVVLPKEKHGYASYAEAERDARGTGMVPIRLAHSFHPTGSLKQALDTVDMRTLEQEAMQRSLNINSRLQPSTEPGRWGLIDRHAAAQLQAHADMISPNSFLRGLRALTGQFRRVALATSFRHLPGVAQEQLIRAAAEGIGPISWLAGKAAIRRMEKIDPTLGRERHIQLTGGTASGQAMSLMTRQVSRHFAGTMLEAPLRSWEKFMRAPVARQLGTLWRSWTRFTIGGTKHILEENAQIGAIGKQVIADFGSRHGLVAAAMGHWGKMIDEAAHGILDENTARRMGAYVRRVYGRWTDLTPGEQTALMFSPFGMWWTNSVAWLMRMPIDHPMGTAFFAGLNAGTQQQREKLGLDMFSPNRLPQYQQGGIPVGGNLWGANYYSPMGVFGNPGETATSLLVPWQAELMHAFAGQDWKGSPITSPSNPAGRNKPTPVDIATVVVNSLLGSFVPLYQKAQTVVQGGSPAYDTSTLFSPKTKRASGGLLKGLEKAVMPIRLQKPAGASSSSGLGGNSLGGGGLGGNPLGGGSGL